MKELSNADKFQIEAAEGWLMLGNPVEANEELEKISPENRRHPAALSVRWQVYAKQDAFCQVLRMQHSGSGLGITPSNDGKLIRVPLPPLTEERRKELSKICKKHGEDTKVVTRGFRRDANEELKKLQKDAKLTEDELRKAEGDTQKLTDQYIQKIDDVVKKKEHEIMEV